MKTTIITTPAGSVVKIPSSETLSHEAITARIRRAEKKTGKLYGHSFGEETVLVTAQLKAKHEHRWAYSDRAGSYQPHVFGKKTFLRGTQHGRGAKLAGQWLIKAAVRLGYSASCLPPARVLREKGVPSIAYRLASGETTLHGPLNRLP